MRIPLWDHQIELNEQCRQLMLGGHKWVLMQGATGIGKSRMAAAQIQAATSKGKTCVFIVPKRDLVRQMSATFTEFGIGHSFMCDRYPFNRYAQVFIATQGTLKNKVEQIKPHVVFVDESHWGAGVLDKIISSYKSIGSYGVGLSATPERLDGKGLGMWYSAMAKGPSIRWLIDNGYLSDYRPFAPDCPDMSQVRTVAGDYAKGELNAMMEQNSVLIGNAVDHYRDNALGKSNVVFCTSVEHAKLVAQSFNEKNIPAASIDGTMGDDERCALIKAFARKELLVLTSVDLLHTGFDLSSAAGMDCTVESMSDLRPTQSLALQMQKWGRVLRKKNYPAFIFDHAGNFDRHGRPCEDREWTLEGKEKKKRTGETAKRVQTCPKCYYVQPPSRVCGGCGQTYEVKSREVEQVDGALVELSKDDIKRVAKREQGKAQTYDELVALGVSRGYKNPKGWAFNLMKARKK